MDDKKITESIFSSFFNKGEGVIFVGGLVVAHWTVLGTRYRGPVGPRRRRRRGVWLAGPMPGSLDPARVPGTGPEPEADRKPRSRGAG